MKMKYALLTSSMLAVGMVGTAAAGVGPPMGDPIVACGGDPIEVCMGDDMVEVEIKCQAPTLPDGDFIVGGIWGAYGSHWEVFVAQYEKGDEPGDDEPKMSLCLVDGYHDLLKTEGKCTDQPNGPTKGSGDGNGKKDPKWAPFGGYAFEYEIKTVDEGACD